MFNQIWFVRTTKLVLPASILVIQITAGQGTIYSMSDRAKKIHKDAIMSFANKKILEHRFSSYLITKLSQVFFYK